MRRKITFIEVDLKKLNVSFLAVTVGVKRKRNPRPHERHKKVADLVILTHLLDFVINHPPFANMFLISIGTDFTMPLKFMKLHKEGFSCSSTQSPFP